LKFLLRSTTFKIEGPTEQKRLSKFKVLPWLIAGKRSSALVVLLLITGKRTRRGTLNFESPVPQK
jgi:hypothetical protein